MRRNGETNPGTIVAIIAVALGAFYGVWVAPVYWDNLEVKEAVTEAFNVYWVSGENEARVKAFARWCVDPRMMAAAASDALFMHCLPAHRGEEVAAEVIDGAQSVVWDEAENRMHVQKALMEYLLLGRIG